MVRTSNRMAIMLSAIVFCTLPSAAASATSLFLDGFEPAPSFGVEPPMLSVASGGVQTRCYYFRAPASAQSVRRISSLAGPGVAYLIVFGTYDSAWVPEERQPPGTWDSDCASANSVIRTGWLHVARESASETVLPDSDGTGRPVAFALAPGQPLVLKAGLVNPTDQPVQAQIDLAFEARHPAIEVTPAASFIADNVNLSIPPMSSDVESRSCVVPAGARFWRLTARTFKLGTRMRILDGAATQLIDGSDWERPPVAEYLTPPFRTFNSTLTYECTYQNNTQRTVTRGDSEETDEVCQGIGWFFPAARPSLCAGNIGPL